jgi:hypothetical protein
LNWLFDHLASLIGVGPALTLMLLTPTAIASALAVWKLDILWGAVVGIVVLVLTATIMLIVGALGING